MMQMGSPASTLGVHGCPPATAGNNTLYPTLYGKHYRSVHMGTCHMALLPILGGTLHMGVLCIHIGFVTNTQSVGERQGQCSLYHQNGSSRLGSRNWKLDRATAVSLTRWAPTFPTTIRHMISYKEVIPMGFLGPTAFPLFDLGSAGPEGVAF